MRRLILSLVLAALTLLAGCAYGVAAAPPQEHPLGPENRSGDPTPETWLADVCTALTPAVRAPTPVPDIRLDDPLGTQQRMLTYLDGRVAALDAAADGINRAGPAPGEAGQSVTEPVVTLLRDRSVQLARLRDQLRAVPAVADDTLVDTLQNVRGQLVLAGPTVVLPDLALPPALTAQAVGVPACRALGLGVPS